MIMPEDLLEIAEGGPAPAGPHPDAALLNMEGSHADFSLFSLEHRDGACPCLEALPEHLVGTVIGLVEEGQRHYALTLIHRFWARTPSGAPPSSVPRIADVIGRTFCYACDSTHHSCGPSPHTRHGLTGHIDGTHGLALCDVCLPGRVHI